MPVSNALIKLLLPNNQDYGLDIAGLDRCGVAVMHALPETIAEAFHVVLLDADNAESANLALIRQCRQHMPACKFLVLFRHSAVAATFYLQQGVTGLLVSLPGAEHLAELLSRLLAGEYYLDQTLAQLLAMRQIKKMLEPFSALSSREFDVFCLLSEGFKLQQIAEQLGISSKTVSNCQTQIKFKLALDNRAALIKFAKNHGLIGH